MHGIRLLLAMTLFSSGTSVLVSAVFYVPWYRRMLKLRDPLEFERSGSWIFPGLVNAPRACLYFLHRDYRRAFDPQIRRHGDIVRWVFSFPLLLAALTLLVAMTAGSWLR